MGRWILDDLDALDTYAFAVNPNEGGSAVPEKSMNFEVMVSPNTNGLLQQGAWGGMVVPFSGSILTRAQDEMMEKWAMRKTRLRLTDDLGRTFVGRLTSLTRNRTRRGTNPWYSTYSAQFVVIEHQLPAYVPG